MSADGERDMTEEEARDILNVEGERRDPTIRTHALHLKREYSDDDEKLERIKQAEELLTDSTHPDEQ
jgi:hypothetical protein